MTMARWLAAVAGLTLVLGAPISSAAATTTVHAKAKAKKRVVRRRVTPGRTGARTAAVARPERQPDGDSAQVARSPRRAAGAADVAPPVPAPPLYVGPPPPPVLSYADYRWLDNAAAMLDAIGGSAPDRTFAEQGRYARYAWELRDGALIIAEPLGPYERRWYFFAARASLPFLIRTPEQSYGYDDGRLVALYDRDGGAQPWRAGDRNESEGYDLLAHARDLWFMAGRHEPLPPRGQLTGWSLSFDWGSDGRGWRENDGWRAYRRGVGYDRERDERYRREREDRARRGPPSGDWRGGGPGLGPGSGYTPPAATSRPQPGRPVAGRPSRQTQPVAEPVTARPARGVPQPVAAAPVAETPMPAPSEAPGTAERIPPETGERPARRALRAQAPPGAETPMVEAPIREPERAAPAMHAPEAPAREPVAEVPRREPAAAVPAPTPAPEPVAPTPKPAAQAAPAPREETPSPPRAEPAPPPPEAASPAAEPERTSRRRDEEQQPQ